MLGGRILKHIHEFHAEGQLMRAIARTLRLSRNSRASTCGLDEIPNRKLRRSAARSSTRSLSIWSSGMGVEIP